MDWWGGQPDNWVEPGQTIDPPEGQDCAALGYVSRLKVDDDRCWSKKPYVCEIPKGPMHTTARPPTTTTTTTIPTTTFCDDCIIPDNVQCNGNVLSDFDKIVGGEEAVPHSWNWIVRMQFNGFGGCGGSILNSEWILTAAHCCEGSSAQDITFFIGDHLYDTDEGTEQTVQAIELIMHPTYYTYDYYYYYYYYYDSYDDNDDQYRYNYDLCLVHVEPITLDGVNANMVCLPEPDEHINPNDNNLPDGPDCYVGGWGSTQGYRQSNTLQSVNVDIYSTEFCHEVTTLDGDFDPSVEFCAGKHEGGKDSCQGDSGGPLICINDANEPVLYGVVSWGYGCASAGYPGIYAMVAAEMDWIYDTVTNYVPWTYQTHFPMWFNEDDGFNSYESENSYQNATDYCAVWGGRLCTFEEYCPNGEYGEIFDTTIPYSFDAYSPFYVEGGDNYNNWLQVGYWSETDNTGHPHFNNTCWVNEWGKPWGIVNYDDNEDLKPGVCCNVRPETVYGYNCTNVRVSDWWDQCYGEPGRKNVLAYYEAVIRDEKFWTDSMPSYGIAGFRGGHAYGSQFGLPVTRDEDNEFTEVPCLTSWRNENYDTFLVCEETFEVEPAGPVNCTECLLPENTRCSGNQYSSHRDDFDKIVGGAVANPHSWPWIVRMQFNGHGGCGGSIINKHWIITAAHCCSGNDPSDISFQVGDHVYSHMADYEQTVQALEIFIHPSYFGNWDVESSDICLVKTEEIYLGGVHEDVVCLPENGVHIAANDDHSPDSPNCYVAGWGTMSYGGSQSDSLLSVDVNIYSAEYCDHVSGYGDISHSVEFCAGKMEGGKDSCQGDSGGPLICVVDGEPILYGIVSWGNKCASHGYPGVYASVAAQMDWIDDTIRSHQGEPTWYDVDVYANTFGTSYSNIANFCESMGSRLCTFSEYCPNGQFGSLFHDIPWIADAYAPFYDPNGDNTNNWLQVGYWYIESASHEQWFNNTCWINQWGKPWGLENDGDIHFKVGVCCFHGQDANPVTTISTTTAATQTTPATTPPPECGDECRVPEGTKCNANAFSSGNRIINGEEVVPHSWPFAARMQFHGFSGCGGSIINSEYILTAAHCCAGYESSPSALTFVIGEHKESDTTGDEQTVTALEVIVHPNYYDETHKTDKDSFRHSLESSTLYRGSFSKFYNPKILPQLAPAVYSKVLKTMLSDTIMMYAWLRWKL